MPFSAAEEEEWAGLAGKVQFALNHSNDTSPKRFFKATKVD